MEESTNPPDLDTRSDIRIGYQAATQMIVYEGQLVWRAKTVFIAFASALVVGSVTSFPGLQTGSLILRLLFSFAGVFATLAWWSMTGRSRTYYKYWIAQARMFEKSLSGVKTFTQGQDLAEGNNVKIDGETIAMTWIHRIRMTVFHHIFYAVVLVVFLGLLVANLVAIGALKAGS